MVTLLATLKKRHFIEESEYGLSSKSDLGEMCVRVCMCICVKHIILPCFFFLYVLFLGVEGRACVSEFTLFFVYNSIRIYTISPRLRGNPAWFAVLPLTQGIHFGFAQGILSPQ